jgi:hypothetical protein
VWACWGGIGEWCCRPGAAESKGRQNRHFDKKKIICQHSENFISLSQIKGNFFKNVIFYYFLIS